jgi:zinc transport system substrate-binding protein
VPERTELVRSPSSRDETLAVLKVAAAIVLAALLVMSLERPRAPAGGVVATSRLSADEVAFADLPAADQRMFRRVREGVIEAENLRDRTGAWPTADALRAAGVPPFAADPLDRAGYAFSMTRRPLVVNYLGDPAPGSGRPAFLVLIVEPDPGTAIDPRGVEDELHHKLPDGQLIHVSIWTGPPLGPPRPPQAGPLAVAPADRGWRRVAVGNVPASDPGAPARDPARPLKIGVTLHPYYSWVANLAADIPGVEVRGVIPPDVDAGNYQPSPDDIAGLRDLDAIVVNGKGHDDFIRDMIRASGNRKIAIIDANDETPLLPAPHGGRPNSHTFLSFANAIQESYFLARQLGAVRPDLAARLEANAEAYAARLRRLAAAAAAELARARITRVVTVHEGYNYILQELGVDIAAVVEPAHGLVPSARELEDMVQILRREKIRVIFSEESFPEKLLGVLKNEGPSRVYLISHIATGPWSADQFEKEMQENVASIVRALVTDA